MGEAERMIPRRAVVAGGLAAMLPVPPLRAGTSPPPARTMAPFATDLRLPGQLYAVIARPPVLGWSLAGFDARAARRVRGVVDVVAIAPWGASDLSRLGGLAVLARDTWSALRGREALAIDWRNDGAPVATGERAGQFVVPRTAESLLETPCVTVRAGDQLCEVWAYPAASDEAVTMLAERLGMRRGAVLLHPTRLGGAPEGGCNPNGVVEAALLSRAVGGLPVSLLWTREDDIPFSLRAAQPVS